MNDPAGINKPAADTGMRRADATADLMTRPARPPEPSPPGPPGPPRHIDAMPDLMAKRRFDIVASAAGLVALLPLLLLIALAVKLDSRGPVFFRQLRVGRHGKPFRIHKFRTMVEGAEHMTKQHIAAEDERVTRAGCFLRRHKLDELPQLIDVLRGRMSLVGPRPQVPGQIAKYPAADREWLLAIRPGITGLATIEFKDEHEILTEDEDPERTYTEQIMPAKLDYNREYYERLKRGQWTVRGDIKIILDTLKALFSRKG